MITGGNYPIFHIEYPVKNFFLINRRIRFRCLFAKQLEVIYENSLISAIK